MAISVKNLKFSDPPCILHPGWRGSPWNCRRRRGSKN